MQWQRSRLAVEWSQRGASANQASRVHGRVEPAKLSEAVKRSRWSRADARANANHLKSDRAQRCACWCACRCLWACADAAEMRAPARACADARCVSPEACACADARAVRSAEMPACRCLADAGVPMLVCRSQRANASVPMPTSMPACRCQRARTCDYRSLQGGPELPGLLRKLPKRPANSSTCNTCNARVCRAPTSSTS